MNHIKTFMLLAAMTALFVGVGYLIGGPTGMAVAFLVGGMLVSTVSTMFANPAVTFARMMTYAICGIAPTSGLIFMAMEVIGALLAMVVFAKVLYPAQLDKKDICEPGYCPPKIIDIK